MSDVPSSPSSPVTPTDLLFRPAAAEWRSALARFNPRAPDSRRFRSELGLPTDRPLIITGHQAAFWHPGILAKFLALDAAAASLRAAPVWLIVDQDHNDPWSVRYPVKIAASRGDGAAATTLAIRTWRADGAPLSAAAAQRKLDIPTARVPPITPADTPPLPGESFAAPHVERGLIAIRAALGAHRSAPTAAAQVSLALRDLVASASAPTLLLATTISRTSLFAELVARMKQEPAACAGAYNGAVARHPHAHIAPLPTRTAGTELPLWRIPATPGSGRTRVCASMLEKIPVHELAPRALLMTGLIRWAACDLFVHGTGGGGAADPDSGYDRITEEWFRQWLGVELAPIAVVSATLRLNIDAEPITPERIARAQWAAHRAQHDPALLGDPDAASRKAALVEEIRSARATGADALPAYRRMHALLEDTRRARAPRLEMFRTDAASTAARKADAAIMADRTWAFPLYEPAQIHGLRTRIAQEFDAVGA